MLLAAGVGGIAYATGVWADAHFGAIADGKLLRIMLLSMSAIVVAVQLGLSGFLLGVLDLRPGSVRAQQARLRAAFPVE